MVTNAEKGQNAVPDRAAADLFGKPGGRVNLLHVDHRAAVGADEVGMGGGLPVEAFIAVHDADGGDNALPLERGKIAVDCAKGQVRDLRLELRVDPFRRRMSRRGTDTFQDRVALFAVLFGGHRFTS